MLQYIGARYVPIFYQNSLDPTSTEWEANVTYEPMTWVSLPNGYMYISKKTVPANIGTPAQNGEYWLEAGQYNAYIQSLQDQIDDMNDGSVSGSLQNQINVMNDGSVPGSLQNQISSNDADITNLGNAISANTALINDVTAYRKNIVLIGDSYLAGGLGYDTFGTVLQNMMPECDFYINSESGSGFGHLGVNGNTFEFLLGNLANTMTNAQKESITDVLVIGGSNDDSIAENLLYTYMDNFTTVSRTHFPNARISCGFNGWTDMSVGSAGKLAFIATRNRYKMCVKHGMAYINGLEFITHNYGHFYNSGHPDGVTNINYADFLANYIRTGAASFSEEAESTLTLASGVNIDTNVAPDIKIKSFRTDDKTIIHINGTSSSFLKYGEIGIYFSTTFGSNAGWVQLGSLSNGLVYGVEDFANSVFIRKSIPVEIYKGADSSTMTTVGASIMIVNGQLCIRFIQGFDYTGFDHLRIPPLEIIADSIYC